MKNHKMLRNLIIILVGVTFAVMGLVAFLAIKSLHGASLLTSLWGIANFVFLLPFVIIPFDRGRSLSGILNRSSQVFLQILIAWDLSQLAIFLCSIFLFFIPADGKWYDYLPEVIVACVYLTVFRSAKRVIRSDIPIELNEMGQLENALKILHLSDVHAGPFVRKKHLSKIIERINSESDFDICVITGDVVNHSSKDLHWALPLLESIKTRHGTYAALGNHEYIDNEDEIIDLYSKSSIKLLLKSSVAIKIGSQSVRLIGVDYPFEGELTALEEIRAALKMSASENSNPELKILLSHHPDGFEAAKLENIPLTLAGHTHGGQVMIMGVSLIQKFVRYIRGIYAENGKFLYVNSGLGNWMPFRVNVPCEYAVITVTGTKSE